VKTVFGLIFQNKEYKDEKLSFLFCFLLMIICGLVSGKQNETTSPTGVDGWWSGVPGYVSGELQVASFTFNFKSDGNILTGAGNTGPTQPMIPIRDGKIEGDQITFWTEIDIGENKLRVNYKGDVNVCPGSYQKKLLIKL